MKKIALILSCEHAVNTIPTAYQTLFAPYENLLNSHQGIDFGALEVALHLQEFFSCELIQAHTSRLFIEYNRHLTKRCFSFITQQLPLVQKKEIITHYYLPYWQKVEQSIKNQVGQGAMVFHCSVHSFTPVLNKKVRNAEIGFLYDPKRLQEKALAQNWQLEIKKFSQDYRIRMNYPYKGISDGLTTAMRKKFAPTDYAGIEIELNQALTQNTQTFNSLKHQLSQSLAKLID